MFRSSASEERASSAPIWHQQCEVVHADLAFSFFFFGVAAQPLVSRPFIWCDTA